MPRSDLWCLPKPRVHLGDEEKSAKELEKKQSKEKQGKPKKVFHEVMLSKACQMLFTGQVLGLSNTDGIINMT